MYKEIPVHSISKMHDGEALSKAFRSSISSSLQLKSDGSQTGKLKKTSQISDPTRDNTTLERNESLSSNMIESQRYRFGHNNPRQEVQPIGETNSVKESPSPSRKRYFSTIENQDRGVPVSQDSRNRGTQEGGLSKQARHVEQTQALDENLQSPPNRNISYTFDESRSKMARLSAKPRESSNLRIPNKSGEPQSDFDSDSDTENRGEGMPKPKLAFSNAYNDGLSHTGQQHKQKLSNGMPKPEYLETLESIMDNYRKPKLLRINHRNEIREMVQKASKRIVIRSFSKRSFDDSQSQSEQVNNQHKTLVRPNRPSVMLQMENQKLDSVDSSKDSPQQRNSLRIYEGHDSPIKLKPSKFKISINGEETEGYADQIDRLATPYLKETPSAKKFQALSRGSMKKEQPSAKHSAKSEVTPPMGHTDKGPNSFTEASQVVEYAGGTQGSRTPKDKSVPNSRRLAGQVLTKERPRSYVDFGKITIEQTHHDEALSRAENMSQESRSIVSEEEFAPKFGRNLPNQTKENQNQKEEPVAGKLGKLGLRAQSHLAAPTNETGLSKSYDISVPNVTYVTEHRGKEKEKEKAEKKTSANRQAASSFPVHVLDVTSPSFDLARFQFLLFSQQAPNKKAFKIFLKEIKQDLDTVKSISFKEPMVRKVIFTNVDPRRLVFI